MRKWDDTPSTHNLPKTWLELEVRSVVMDYLKLMIIRTASNRRSLELDKGTYHLWRLSEDEYRKLRQSSVPITFNSFVLLHLWMNEQDDPERLTLGKALLSLEALFGSSSDFFDTWKCSFTFPLLLQFTQPNGQFFYLIRIGDYRGMLDFCFYRFLASGPEGHNIDVYQDPVEHEFSCKDIDRFICCIYGFLSGMGSTLKPPQPFLMQVESQCLIYGYDGSNFFEEDFDSEEAYQAAIAIYKQKYDSPEMAQQTEDLRSLVASITEEAPKSITHHKTSLD